MAKRFGFTKPNIKTNKPPVKTNTPKPQERKTEPRSLHEYPPEKSKRSPRRFIPASMPTVCPECGHNTRMTDGRHTDPVHRTILEYRDCVKCEAKLAAGRPMTEREVEKFCGRSEAVAEYEASKA